MPMYLCFQKYILYCWSYGLAKFYRNGFLIHTWVKPPVNQNLLDYIENEVLLNDAYIAKLKNKPDHIGVFQINDFDIEIENWEDRTMPFSYYGNILDNVTFVINKSISHRTGEVFEENLTYRFKEFSPKPDSLNNYTRFIVLDD